MVINGMKRFKQVKDIIESMGSEEPTLNRVDKRKSWHQDLNNRMALRWGESREWGLWERNQHVLRPWDRNELGVWGTESQRDLSIMIGRQREWQEREAGSRPHGGLEAVTRRVVLSWGQCEVTGGLRSREMASSDLCFSGELFQVDLICKALL